MNFLKLKSNLINTWTLFKRIIYFVKRYILPFFVHYGSLLLLSIVPIYLMLREKPKSLYFIFAWFVMLIICRILAIKIKFLNKYCSKIINYAKIIPITKNKRLTYIEAIALSFFITDLTFEKTFSIVACIITIFVFIALDIVYNTSFNITPIVHFIAVFISILLGFYFIWIIFNYNLPIMVILICTLLMTIFEHFSYKVKKFDQPLLFSIFTAFILSFFKLSVIP